MLQIVKQTVKYIPTAHLGLEAKGLLLVRVVFGFVEKSASVTPEQTIALTEFTHPALKQRHRRRLILLTELVHCLCVFVCVYVYMYV